MSAQFGLFLGDDRIPVINWINRHGSPEGRDLRFTVPTEVKAKLEANREATYRLERDGKQWEFQLLKITQHGTGTNGVPAVGRVKVEGRPVEAAKKPRTGVGIPKLDGTSEASDTKKDHGFKRQKSSLKELLLKKKAERRAEREASEVFEDPKTADGLPTAEDADPAATAKGMPAVESGEEE